MDEKTSNNQISKPMEQGCAYDAREHVVAHPSLKGIGGWLIYWMIQFTSLGIYGLLFFFIFLAVLANGGAEGTGLAILIESVILLPFVAGAAIASLVLIGMRKKVGKLMALITFGVTALYTTILAITGMTAQLCSTSYDYSSSYYYHSTPTTTCTGIGASGIIMLIGAIVITLVVAGLSSLYFLKSKRVKLTLTK